MPRQMNRQEKRSRIVVVEYVYFQSPDGEPIVVDPKYTHWLESDEQPYIRQLNLTEQWIPLEIGWLNEIGCSEILIVNKERSLESPTNPFGTNQNAQMKVPKVPNIEIAVEGCQYDDRDYIPTIVITPGKSCRLPMVNQHLYRIRSSIGNCRAMIHVFPA